MPNGLSSAPRCFTKLLKTVYSTLRQYGHINVGYIDDSYLQGSDTKECLLNISGTQTLFTRLGFVINVEKSCFIPAQKITFLGFVLDSVSMTIALTEDKKDKVKANCKALLPQTNITITELAQLVSTLELRTDASKKGWGVYLDGDTTQGLWSVSESQLHISELELKAVHFAVQAFGDRLQNKHVKILCDNSTTVAYVNAMGGTKSPGCNQIAYDIWDWCVNNNSWLTATHIAGVENTEADKESQLFNDRTEWTLKREIFARITTHWGTPEIDLFATRLNTQLSKFVSWKPEPFSCFVDAFTISWSSLYFYAFPPFCQIHRCLQNILEEQAPQGIMILPFWPTQVW